MSARAGSHRVEAVIDEMLQVLAHANLPHQLVFIPVHARQLPHVGENILQSICQLQHKCPTRLSARAISTISPDFPRLLTWGRAWGYLA